jgi:hypothetical protein
MGNCSYQNAKIGGWCSLWSITSVLIILLNNFLMNIEKFRYPMLLSSAGLAFTTIVLWTCQLAGISNIIIRNPYEVLQLFPIALCMALTLAIGNAAYMFLSVSLIQLLKAGAPVCTLFVALVTRTETPNLLTTVAVLLIVLGCGMSVSGEMRVSWIGVGFVVCGELLEACRIVLTQRVMTTAKLSTLQLVAHVSPLACVFLWVVGAFFEGPALLQTQAHVRIAQNPLPYVVAATLGFFINVMSVKIIQLTSGLTLKVLAQAKNTATVVAAILVFGNTVTALQWVSYLISGCGYVTYHFSRNAAPL